MSVAFEAEKKLPVRYDGSKMDMGYLVDLIVESKVIVEVKAVETIQRVHEAQLLSYLRLSGIRVGLLINFNVSRVHQGTGDEYSNIDPCHRVLSVPCPCWSICYTAG
jgi:GxxExxY protein